MVKGEELTLICPIRTNQCEVPFPTSLSFLMSGSAASTGDILLDQ